MRHAKILRGSLLVALLALTGTPSTMFASSHREAPLISNDPLADNTDLYAFRSPDDGNGPATVTILANYIPFELPEGGPNYYSFGENIRYEIHIRNQAVTNVSGGRNGDDITYRFTFTRTNEDPTTFFNIRLGKQNIKTTYTCQKSVDGGMTWTNVLSTPGTVPPTNIGPRSIETPVVGLGTPYATLMQNAVTTGAGGEKIFAGPIDDPFFVDLGGIFDLGGFNTRGKDGLAGFNCHTIAMKIPITELQAQGHSVDQATNILDPNFVIGVWASASRPRITTLSDSGKASFSTDFIMVSRLGMPLTNEAIIPIGMKDKWNSFGPNETAKELATAGNFSNPELSLYTGGKNYSPYGFAIPGLTPLKIDSASLKYLGLNGGKGFDFRYGKRGLFPLLGNTLTQGTALDTVGGPAAGHFGSILIGRDSMPRSVDLLPIFFTGVPNAIPYQLATGKNPMNPLTAGKPFINNFLPTLGDMLRLNMAVPPTSRTDPNFSNLGLIKAAVLGLTDSHYANPSLQDIPNMDGFPNGRRLEDDVTTIEMQAVGGLVLNAIGLWTDDYNGTGAPTTPHLLGKVLWNAGVTHNDVPLQTMFPYAAVPHRGSIGLMRDPTVIFDTTYPPEGPNVVNPQPGLALHPQSGFFVGQSYPNPTSSATTISFHSSADASVIVQVYDINGKVVDVLMNEHHAPGDYRVLWNPAPSIANGTYFTSLYIDGTVAATMKITLSR